MFYSNKLRVWIRIGYLLIICLPAAAAENIQLEVFTDTPINMPVTPGFNVVVYDLNAPKRYETDRSVTITGRSVKEAESKGMDWFRTLDKKKLSKVSQQAFLPLAKAAEYQLPKYPAIVFEEGLYAVYGTLDIQRAIRDYRAAKKKLFTNGDAL